RRGPYWPLVVMIVLAVVLPGACLARGIALRSSGSRPALSPSPTVVAERSVSAPDRRAGFDTVAHGVDGVRLVDPARGVLLTYRVDRATTRRSGDEPREVRFRPAAEPGDHVDRLSPDASWLASLTVPEATAPTTGTTGRTVRPVVRLYDASAGRVTGGTWTMPEVTVSGTQPYRADDVAVSRAGRLVAAAVGGAPSGPTTPGRVTA